MEESGVELAFEDEVEAFGAAVGGESLVDELGVDDALVGELLGEAVEPAALGGAPGLEGGDPLHGGLDALVEGDEGFADGCLADEADDAGGDVGVGLVASGVLEVRRGLADGVEREADFLELRSGEVAGAEGGEPEGVFWGGGGVVLGG